MTKISLKFHGYWCDYNLELVPNISGVYCVYRGLDHGAVVGINDLLYVGEAEAVRERIATHEMRPEWRRQLKYGEILLFSIASIKNEVSQQASAAIVHRHNPPLNGEFTLSYPFDDTEVFVKGCKAKLDSNFTVRRTSRLIPRLVGTKPFQYLG